MSLLNSAGIWDNPIKQTWVLVILSLGLYINTLMHDFAVDDGIVITKNEYVTRGFGGIWDLLTKDTFRGFFKKEGKDKLVAGGRYRPLTPVAFAIVYEFVGATPAVYHLLSMGLFALVCMLLLKLLQRLLRPSLGDSAIWLGFVACLIFAAHPVHTEVVANIKGMDETAALLFSVLAFQSFLNGIDRKRNLDFLFGSVFLFLGLMSKENAVSFVVLIPAGLWWLYGQSFGTALRAGFWLTIPVILFLFIRAQILGWNPIAGESGELMNNPFLKFSNGTYVLFSSAERYATIFYTLIRYIGLLFFPHPLTYDYYPRHIAIQNFSSLLPILSVLLHLAMLAGIFIFQKRNPLLSLALLWYLIPLSLVCNLVFPIGTFMGERFLFMPSVGFSLIAAWCLLQLKNKNTNLAFGILVIVLVLFAIKTVTRNQDWKNDFTLILHDAKISKNSAKINNAVGGILLDNIKNKKDSLTIKNYIASAKAHLNRAIELHPFYFDAYNLLGNAHFMAREYDQAISKYEFVLRYLPDDAEALNNLHLSLREGARYKGMSQNDPRGAIAWLDRALQLKPDDDETLSLLGVAHGVIGSYDKALEIFGRVVARNPTNPEAHFNLYLTYMNMGDSIKAQAALAEAQKYNPDILKKFNGQQK